MFGLYKKEIRKYKKNPELFFNGDISICPNCGEYERIVHIIDRSLSDAWDNYPIIGFVCCKCLWSCGDANILTAIKCKIETIFMKYCWKVKTK